jgi:hypothetical protein
MKYGWIVVNSIGQILVKRVYSNSNVAIEDIKTISRVVPMKDDWTVQQIEILEENETFSSI